MRDHRQPAAPRASPGDGPCPSASPGDPRRGLHVLQGSLRSQTRPKAPEHRLLAPLRGETRPGGKGRSTPRAVTAGRGLLPSSLPRAHDARAAHLRLPRALPCTLGFRLLRSLSPGLSAPRDASDRRWPSCLKFTAGGTRSRSKCLPPESVLLGFDSSRGSSPLQPRADH